MKLIFPRKPSSPARPNKASKRALGLPRVAADEHDQTCARLLSSQCEEIVPVARHQQQPLFAGGLQHLGVSRRHRQNRTQLSDIMTFLPQHPRDIRGHVVIAEKPHAPAVRFIWRAISASISAR